MKKAIAMFLSLGLAAGLLAGCGGSGTPSSSEPGASSPEKTSSAATEPAEKAGGAVRLAAMKGPTSMGLVKLLADNEAGALENKYTFTMTGAADEIVAGLGRGELDIAAVPCNLAAVLYQNTQGGVKMLAVNTLGVLYVVETGDTVHSVEDLRGKTIYTTGKGTTPEFALNYILTQNGIDPQNDVTIEYKSESTEVAAQLEAATEPVVAMLPEPYVTTVRMKNDKIRAALDLTEEWDKLGGGGALVTGVAVARSEFIESNPEAVETFLEEYSESIAYVNANAKDAAALVEKYGIVPSAAIAEAALPRCNIAYIDGEEMKTKAGGYLEVLFSQNPKSVGGALPDDAFYYQK